MPPREVRRSAGPQVRTRCRKDEVTGGSAGMAQVGACRPSERSLPRTICEKSAPPRVLATSSGTDEGGERSRAGEKGGVSGQTPATGAPRLTPPRRNASFGQCPWKRRENPQRSRFLAGIPRQSCSGPLPRSPGTNAPDPASAQVRWVPGRRRNAGPANHAASRRMLLLAPQPVPAKRREEPDAPLDFDPPRACPMVRIDHPGTSCCFLKLVAHSKRGIRRKRARGASGLRKSANQRGKCR